MIRLKIRYTYIIFIFVIAVVFIHPNSVIAKSYSKNGFKCDDSGNTPGGVPCTINVGTIGRMIYSGGYGTALKYDTKGNLIICVEHEKGQPSSQCVLKYQDYNRYVIVGLGGALHRASMNGLEDQKYVELALAQNNILYNLGYYVGDITQTFYTSRVQEYENAGLQDAVDYYHYSSKSKLGNLNLSSSIPNNVISNVDTTGKSTFNIKFDINTSNLGITKNGRTVTKKIDYDNYSIDSVLLNNKKISYSENCDKKSSSCVLTIKQNLLKSGANKIKVIVKIRKQFYEAALYDCTGQDVTFSTAYPGENKEGRSLEGEITIKVPSCEDEFNSLSDYSNLQLRYMLYNKWYKQKGVKYNNLFNLNFKANDGARACSVRNCTGDYDMSCLNYSKKKNNQGETDFSCFSDMDGYYNNEFDYRLNYICDTSFKFENNLGNTAFNIKPGIKIMGTDDKIATGVLTKFCSAHPVENNTSILVDPYIIDYVKFNNYKLNYILNSKYKYSHGGTVEKTLDPTNIIVEHLENGNTSTEFYYDFYAPDDIYMKISTGKIVENLSDSSRNVTRGVYAQYDWKKSFEGIIPFSIKFKNNSSNGGVKISNHPVGNLIYTSESRLYFPEYINETDEAKQCKYNWDGKGLIPPGDCTSGKCLNLEFRIIDVDHPFIDRDGNNRNTMTNWCYSKDDELEELIKENLVYEKDDEYYYKDTNSKVETSCSFDNNLVKRNISYAPDSYGMQRTEINEKKNIMPKYKITLTPQLMKKISNKADELELKYNIINFNCEADICKSKLLNYLKEKNNLIVK